MSKKTYGISLIDTPIRRKGKVYEITSNLRSKKITFKDSNGQMYSAEKNAGWKFYKK